MAETLAIVVTFNRLEKLKKCLESLGKQTHRDFDVLVVDNASTDETGAYLAEQTGKVAVLTEKENVGGAGGFHDGMKYGTEHGYKYLWLMDDDVYPAPDALEKLFVADENLKGEYGFLSSFALFTDGTPAEMNNHLLKSKITTDSLYYAGETYLKVLSATFVSFFIKTETVKKFGYPVKEMFLWSDDTEYSTRITKKENGYFIPQSVVTHAMEKNEKPDLVTLSYDRIPRMVLNIRNRYYIAKRDGFKKKMRFYARPTILFFRVLFKAKDHRFSRLKAIFDGTLKGWFFRPKIEK